MNALMGTLILAADDGDDIDPTTGHGPEWGKASPMGLLVILLMGIALFFLLRSMVKHIKKVQAMNEPSPQEQDPPPPAGVDNEAAPSVQPDGEPDPVANADPGSGPPGLVDERSG